MKPKIQTFMSEAGKAACYALCIIRIAELWHGKDILDPVATLSDGIGAGFIKYGPKGDPDNFYVLDPAGFLGSMTGKKWIVSKQASDYVAQPGEHIVQRWERKTTAGTIGHFRMADWDSLDDADVIGAFSLASVRVFKEV